MTYLPPSLLPPPLPPLPPSLLPPPLPPLPPSPPPPRPFLSPSPFPLLSLPPSPTPLLLPSLPPPFPLSSILVHFILSPVDTHRHTLLLSLMACIQSVKSVPLEKVTNIRPHELAQHLHSSQPYMLLDCRPVLAYNTCHISGAVNVNFTGEAHVCVCGCVYVNL